MGECLYKRFIICLKNFNDFFMYLFIKVKEGGGGALMHVYVWVYGNTETFLYRND